ncbi:MAG TPA: hypothetical protein VFM94_01545 [Solirubrobacterales bacterium]|nr:hypothetical protein [Solirubrobacterales bacterium]
MALKRRLHFAVALIGLLLAIGVSSALADEGSESSSGPSLSQVEEAIADPALQTVEMPHTNYQAAEELPHQDLSRDQANELLTAVFGPLLQGPAGIFDELDVEKFYSDNVALIGAGDQPTGGGSAEGTQPTILESSLPLREEDNNGHEVEVDLGLEKSEGELQPENPLVDVEIPAQIGEGISLPQSGIEIELAGAPVERGPSTVDESVATYPSVAEDTMLAVAPTATGLETLALLQSADAPTAQTFHLTLPDGASLHETDDGGAEVSRNGETMMAIRPPSAIDADEAPVPVHLETSGNSLTIVAEPGGQSSFPILVDPMWETYYWFQHTTTSFAGWDSFSNSSVFTTSHNGQHEGVWDPGLQIGSGNTAITPGAQARWDYHVPRWATDVNSQGQHIRPTSYIRRVIFEKLFFDVQTYANGPAWQDPFLALYLWDEEKQEFVAIGHRYGTEGNLTDMNYQYNLYNFPPPQENARAKQASLELVSNQSKSQYRQLYAGLAGVELTDVDFPIFGFAGDPLGWVNNAPTFPIRFEASDPGLGVREISATMPLSSGGTKKVSTLYSPGCTGGAMSPCPPRWSHTAGPAIDYDPSLMPQGEDEVPINAFDPLGHNSALAPGAQPSKMMIKVDHTAPVLSPLSGTLAEQEKVGASAAQYTLKFNASDGDHEAPNVLSSYGTAGTGTGQLQRPMGIAVDGNSNIWVADRENNRIVKFDEAGNFLMQFGTTGTGNGQFKDPRGIAISSNGTIWVSEVGNKRVQAFNSQGEFIRSFTYTSFIEPYGLATGPGGILWVADPAAHRVFEFNETGGFIRKAYGSPTNPTGETEIDAPVGLATDSQGNVWVADNGASRVTEFDANGKYVFQFGSTGTGNGQLQNPVNIAVAASGNLFVTDGTNNRVQEFQPSGAYLRQFGSTGSGSGQLKEPRGIAVAAENKVLVIDAGNRRIARWGHADYNPQSGVATTEIKVDGQLAEKYSPGCPTRDCTINREWTLKASDYASGQHNVEVIATDGVELKTTKSLSVTTVKDTTAPKLTGISSYFTANKGWMEQKSYSYSTSVSDIGGHGVTSYAFKIDGKTVKSVTQSCPNGGCGATLSGSIDMAAYNGGAHPAELVATDAAGNTFKVKGTFNVDPKGSVSVDEATDTIEAVEGTSSVNLIGEPQVEEEYPGTAPSLGIQESNGQLQVTGTFAPTTVGAEPTDGVTMQILDDGIFAALCEPAEPGGPEQVLEGEEVEQEVDDTESCNTPAEIEAMKLSSDEDGLTAIELTPVGVGGAATENKLVGEVATVAANTGAHVDTIVRPLYDGIMTFQALRDALAPETFAWEVRLDPNQELTSIDDKHAQVYYESGRPAFSIAAIPAADAIGTVVPTKLGVSGKNIITLTVEHHAKAVEGHAYVYPISAGAGWEGGFQTSEVLMPPPELPEEEGGSESEGSEVNGADINAWAISPPEHATASQAGFSPMELSTSEARDLEHRHFRFVGCHAIEDAIFDPGKPLSAIVRDYGVAACGNPFVRDEGPDYVAFNYATRGDYFRISGVMTKHLGDPTDHIDCDKMYAREHFGDALVEWDYFINPAQKCRWWGHTQYSREPIARNENGYSHHITPYGEWNWGRRINPNKKYDTDQKGLALYIWTSKRNHIGHHETTCIDC